jgi:hypothetical protein
MAFKVKALWVEDLDDATTQARVMQHAQAIGATLLCVRTTSALLQSLIATYHGAGLKVYGWMWTSVIPKQSHHRYARDEADHVAKNLIPNGLDGYVFDVESDDGNPPTPHDWDRTDVEDLTQLATYYTTTIRKAFVDRKTPYRLGMTSHARGFSNYPGIPWKPFLDVRDTLYPQTYWRFNNGTPQNKQCVDEAADPITKKGKGTPEQAVINGYTDYGPKNKPIIPIAGEIGCATADEMTRFGKAVSAKGATEATFMLMWMGRPSMLTSFRRLKRCKRPR